VKLSTEATLQEERRLRMQTEQALAELKEKYDILVAKTNSTSNNPTPNQAEWRDYLRTYRL
jgi:hypothetical protein